MTRRAGDNLLVGLWRLLRIGRKDWRIRFVGQSVLLYEERIDDQWQSVSFSIDQDSPTEQSALLLPSDSEWQALPPWAAARREIIESRLRGFCDARKLKSRRSEQSWVDNVKGLMIQFRHDPDEEHVRQVLGRCQPHDLEALYWAVHKLVRELDALPADERRALLQPMRLDGMSESDEVFLPMLLAEIDRRR